MKIPFLICLLSLSLQCFGNKTKPNLVNKIDSLSGVLANKELEIKGLQDSIMLYSTKFNKLKSRLADYEVFKGESKGNDSAVWEYGSSIVAILTAIIILFGLVYYNSSKQAARDAFDDQFENYSSVIKHKIIQAQLALDKLDSRVDIIDEVEEDIDKSSKSIENEFK